MPTVSIPRDALFERLGKTYTDEEFEELCFEYGIELDDVIQEKNELDPSGAEETVYKIDIPANRYDMLCIEGISRALNIFKGRIQPPTYRVADMTGKQMQKLIIKPETALVRPFAVAAVLRGVKFDAARYKSFIELQDKLHQNLCRQRTLVAIGTHDLDTIQGPFTYEALAPESISFVPLKQTAEFDAKSLMAHYEANDLKLRKFVPIIKDSVVYPVIYDAARRVLSLPPIINGAHSAISLETKNVFIECTATDLNKAKIVLNTVCTMFAEYCERVFEVEPVEVVDAFGESACFPDFSPRTLDVSVDQTNKAVGIQIPSSRMAELLKKMQLEALVIGHDEHARLRVKVPPTRSDILHACDIYEDIAIAYGYNNIQHTVPPTVTIGKELPLNQLTELLRLECAMAGFTEILTWALISKAENFENLRRVDTGEEAVTIGNPATVEFEVCRSTLLPSALKTLGANKKEPLPVKLFEVSDAILLDPSKDVGAANRRKLVAVHCNTSSEFEVIHGLLDRVMETMGVPRLGSGDPREGAFGGGYEWRACDDLGTLFPGRQAKVYVRGKEVGYTGVVHPEVLGKFDIVNPVCCLELDVEHFLYDQGYKPLAN